MGKDIHPVKVFQGQLYEAELVKSLLENAEIESYLVNEHMGILEPWVVTAGGAGAIKITVSSEDEEKAKLVIDEYLKNTQKAE